MSEIYKKGHGKAVLLCFVGFFGIIVAVNSGFIYMAIQSNTGVITENAYEKGLAYNEILDAARSQPSLKDKMTYQNNTLKWALEDDAGQAIKNGEAVVFFMRPVKSGYDFSVPLTEKSPGVYVAQPDFPMHGLWTARLDIKWNGKKYQTTQDLIVK